MDKRKIIAIAIIFTTVISLFAVFRPTSAAILGGIISATESGATDHSWSATTTVGGPVTVDIRIDNVPTTYNGATKYYTSALWAWVANVSWSPNTLQLVGVSGGSYLRQSGGTFMIGDSSALWDNANGRILGGLMQSCSSSPQPVQSKTQSAVTGGVLATLSFIALNTGVGTVNIADGLLKANASDTGISVDMGQNAQVTIDIASVPLTVMSSHGSPTPAVGTQSFLDGQVINATVVSPVIEGTTAWICTGWNGTGSVVTWASDSGDPIYSGSGTSVLFYMDSTQTDPSTLTWNWEATQLSDTSLTVISDHGNPTPSIGNHTYTYGNEINATVDSPVIEGNLSYTCIGWTGTGSVPASGNGTSTNFSLTVDSSITWLWRSNASQPVELTIISDHGHANPSAGNNEYYSGDVVTCNIATTSLMINGIVYNITSDGGVVYACTGWTGSGSISSGFGTSVTFVINENSSITWNWQPIPASIDVSTNKGGKGSWASTNVYGPEEQVIITANLTSEGGVPVSEKTVTFNIFDNGVQIDSRSAITNSDGIANLTYRLPWPNINPTASFGIINITSTASVAGVIVTDYCPFMYNYILSTSSVSITNSDAHGISASNGPYFSRYTGPVIQANVVVTNRNWNNQSFYITATIYDNNSVAVAYISLPQTIIAAQAENPNSTTSQTYTINLNLPSYAFVGAARLYVNIYTDSPINSGVPFCPEASTLLMIEATK